MSVLVRRAMSNRQTKHALPLKRVPARKPASVMRSAIDVVALNGSKDLQRTDCATDRVARAYRGRMIDDRRIHVLHP